MIILRRIALIGLILVPVLTLEVAADELYFPPSGSDWERIVPADAGWDSTKLETAVEFAGEQKSSGVVVLYRGRILAERYWELNAKPTTSDGRRDRYYFMLHGKDASGHSVEDVASIQKSVAATLVGIALQKGILKLDDPVEKYLGEAWSNAPRESESVITLEHLISMSSGLTDDLKYEAPAGTRWRYNTNAYSRINRVLEVAASADRHELTKKWLTDRIGMQNSRWVDRPLAKERPETNQFGFATTARDLARFGLLILADGRWNAEAVVENRDYLSAMLRPSQKMNPSYGYLWWLNGQTHVRRGSGDRRAQGPLIDTAPEDLVAGLGALGRKVYVVPSLNLVVTRFGDQPARSFDTEFWRRLMDAAPWACEK